MNKVTFPRFHSKWAVEAKIKLVFHDDQIQLVPPRHGVQDCVLEFTRGEACTMSCTDMQVFTTQQRTVRFFYHGFSLIFLNKCPHSLAFVVSIFSLFTIKIIFKPDHFLFFSFFFKGKLRQRENRWAETQSKARPAHALLFFYFHLAQLWLKTSVFRFLVDPSPWYSKHYIFTLTQRGVRLCFIYIMYL